MKWELNEIKVGDAVRVNMGLYYHYGICTAEDRIVQFGLPEIGSNPDTIEVCATDINRFLNGKFAEVMVLSKKELKNKNDTKTIIEKAEKSIGEKGYNILHNNCEHFMNRCIFNVSVSKESNDVQKEIRELITPKEIFVAPIKNFVDNQILPTYTRKELSKISNENIRNQKISAYGLLKYAVEKTFGINENFKKFKKLKNGKPVCDDYQFSISHSKDLVAVVVSKCEVGIDIEEINFNQNVTLLKNAMKSEDEDFESEDIKDIITIWTQKESVFKFQGKSNFNPKEINHKSANTKTIELEYDEAKYVLTVATNNTMNVKITKLFD